MVSEDDQILLAIIASTTPTAPTVDSDLAEAIRRSQELSQEEDAKKRSEETALLEAAQRLSSEQTEMDQAERDSFETHAFDLAKERSKKDFYNNYIKEFNLQEREKEELEEALRLSLHTGLDKKYVKENLTIDQQSQGSSAQLQTSVVPGTAASSSSQSSSSSMSSNLELGNDVQAARARRQQLNGNK